MSNTQENGLPEENRERTAMRDHHSVSKRKNVTKLKVSPPKTEADEPEAALRRRVAVYCRVSTSKDSQNGSLQAQMVSFRRLIDSREGWELVEVYADRGFSGTTAAGREAFCRMIDDCEAGKIDYILTKSISRFARNTMECLEYVRRLKEFGIRVYFEKENLDTGDEASEMLLSVLAAIAQEESRDLSENLKWGCRKRFESGKVKWSATYGYKKEDGVEFIVDEETAPVVRRIFEEYYLGKSLPQIVTGLEADGIHAAWGGKWYPKRLAEILGNERYIGDALCQKSYTVNHLTHERLPNRNSEVPSYYIHNHHTPIVDKHVYETVQEIRAMKDPHKGPIQYPYQGRIICPICGEKLVRNVLPRNNAPAVWHCPPENGNTVCAAYYIDESYLNRIVRQAYAELDMEQLQKQKNRRNKNISESAQEAIKFKEEMPELDTVEYYFLKLMVDRITFKKWDTAVVHWKFGLKSTVAFTYDNEYDTPYNKKQLSTNSPKKWQKIAEEAAKEKANAEKANIKE